jgi:hypothetical protein
MTIPFTAHFSEKLLLERTYHAQLRNGRELVVPNFTEAMKNVTNFSIPFSTWQEITPEEALAAYQQGIPVLLYGESAWENLQGASGIDYAVCYCDSNGETFSNASWRIGFSSDTATIFDGSGHSTITFLGPWMPLPFTTHYTVIASDGHVHEYRDRARAMEGFHAFSPQEVRNGSQVQIIFPQFCYYHEVTCPGGVYRIEFFGPRMNENGYTAKNEQRIL